MNASNWLNAIPPLILSVLVGILGYFLKRTIGMVDKHDAQIGEIREKFVTREELGELKAEIQKLHLSIDSLKENGIGKEDFVREISNLQRQNERTYDILLEMKGEHGHG